jgi:hypothetical protein
MDELVNVYRFWQQVPFEFAQVPFEFAQVPFEFAQVPFEFAQVRATDFYFLSQKHVSILYAY